MKNLRCKPLLFSLIVFFVSCGDKKEESQKEKEPKASNSSVMVVSHYGFSSC
jgi:hypothetical protein